MKSNRDQSLRLFAAKAVLKRARPLLEEAEGVCAGKDLESVHRMRVATRRLSMALRLFEDVFPRHRVRSWEKRLRRLRRSLGKARDLDVQLAFLAEFLRQSNEFLGGLAETEYRPGIERLVARLRRHRAARQRKVVKAIHRFQKQEVLPDLKRTAKDVRSACRSGEADGREVRRRAREAILERLEDLLALEPCVSQPDSIAEHHAMRIAAKRLRYTLEVFRPLYGASVARFVAAAQEAQQRLGDIHDCDVWAEFLPRFLEAEEAQAAARPTPAKRTRRVRPGILFLEQDRRRQRQRLFKDFVARWQKQRQSRLWEQLVALVHAEPAAGRPATAPSRPSEAA